MTILQSEVMIFMDKTIFDDAYKEYMFSEISEIGQKKIYETEQ